MSINAWRPLSLAILLGSCCAHDNKQIVDSPDSRHQAYACVLDCASVSSFTPTVWLFDINWRPLMWRTNNERPIFRCEGSGNISVRWVDSKSLLITTGCDLSPNNKAISIREYKFKDIAIKYEYKSEWSGE